MRATSLLVLALSFLVCQGQNIAQQTCQADRQMVDINVAGSNVLIGGIMQIRGHGENGFGCGAPDPALMQVYEAARFAINFLNQGYLPGVNFGMRVYDSCGSNSQALNALLNLYPQSQASSPYCTQNNQALITGIFGPLKSNTAIAVADVAGRMPASLISPSATSPELSDNFKYPTFQRTTPSNAVMARAIVELLDRLRWQNVMVMYVEDDYGMTWYQDLLKAAYAQGLCVSQAVGVPASMDVAGYVARLQGLNINSFTPAVFLGSNQQARTMLRAAQQVSAAGNVQWIFSDLDTTQDISTLNMARGAMVLELSAPLLTQFRDYFAGLEQNPTANNGNPWFEDWYESTYGCSLTNPNNRCPTRTLAQIRDNFVQSQWVLPTMKAMFAYAETIRSICGNFGPGVCTSLRNMSPGEFNSRLKSLNFTFDNNFSVTGLRGQRIRFDNNGDPLDVEYSVYNFNNQGGPFAYREVGRYSSGVLTINPGAAVVYDPRRTTAITLPTASCIDVGCDSCLLPQTSVSFRYQPGDIVIASLVDAHLPSSAAFTCGAGVAARLSALVAAEWAVSQFKDENPGKLQGVSLGSLVADVCPDSYVSDSFLVDLLSGNNRLIDETGRVISPSNIYAFVDQTGNNQAVKISQILSSFMLPEIQTGATTSALMGAQHPYFNRAIPSEEVYFTAIASLLQKLGWNYVQVAGRTTAMYQEQMELFRRLAASYGVCITGFADFANGLDNVVSTLSANTGTVVVVIAEITDLQEMLEEIETKGITGFQLVSGIEAWSRDPKLVTWQAATGGLIMLEPELSSSSTFRTWMTGLTVNNVLSNQFLRELFEVTNQCSLTPSTRGLYTRSCGTGDSFDFYQGKTPYVIESVNLVANKLHDLIVEICQDTNYNGLCPEFRAAPDIMERLDAKLRNSGASSAGFEIRDGESLTDYNFYVYRNGQYVQFGAFTTANHQLSNLDVNQISSANQHRANCNGACMECQYLYTLQGRYIVPGDWLLVGTFSISQPGPEHLRPYICGDIREVNGPQYTTAMLYALDRVNSGRAPVSVRGVNIGGLIMDHCNNEGRVNLMVSDVFSGQLNTVGVDQTRVLSWLTDNTASSNEAAQVLDPLGIAMVSPSATAPNLMEYPVFHRTVQGDTTVASALIKVVKQLGFPYIQVAYSANSYGREGLKTLQAVTEAEGLCITSMVEMDRSQPNFQVGDIVRSLTGSSTQVVVLFMDTSDTRTLLQAIKENPDAQQKLLLLMAEPYTQVLQSISPQLTLPVISLQLQRPVLADYNAYLNSSPIQNPYFARYYMKMRNCNLPGYSVYSTPCSFPLAGITETTNYEEDNWVLSTINAVYASVDALDRTLKEYCGTNYTAPCTAFMQSPTMRQRYNVLLNSVNFVDAGQNNFRFLDRQGNVEYDILQSTMVNGQMTYRKVGSYGGVALQLNDNVASSYTNVLSTCIAPCLGCINRGLNFSHTPGDIYIAGVFDVHERSFSPFTCGQINTLHGFLLLEAFHFALNQVNEKKGEFANILQGTRLGGVGLDACGSAVRGGYLVSNINNGMTTLAKDGVIISPSKIDTYIASYGSGASIYMARILTDLGIPQISYAATSSLLSDERLYPYFFRTIPSDKYIIEAMLTFLDKNNIRYVQILYSDNENSNAARMMLENMAANYSVCVAQTVAYPFLGSPTPEASNEVVSQLINNPAANTVITFLDTEFVNSVLGAVGRSERARNKLRFFGDTKWADNQDALDGVEQFAVGSLTIKLDDEDVDSFESYIDSIANSEENPWFTEYYQRIHNCYISKTNTMGYPRLCSLSRQSTIISPRYQQDPDVVHVINAVYAAAYSIHATLVNTCGANYATVCQAYWKSSLRRDLIRNNLENVEFIDPLGHQFKFYEREVLSDFRFYTISAGQFTGANYEQVGTFNYSTEMVSMNPDYKSSWNSDCDRVDACSECPAIRDNGVRYYIYNNQVMIPKDATTIVAFFDIHEQGVDPYRCGKLNIQGFHHFLAFLYGANQLFGREINDNARGLRLIAIDTCSNSLRVDQDLFGLLQGSGLCNTQFNEPDMTLNIGNLGSVLTVGNDNTMAASRVLEAPGITYISPNALSTALDSKEHLARTVSPISGQMQAMVNLLKSMGWTYVDSLYEDSVYGVQPWERFNYLAGIGRICQGSAIPIGLDATDSVIIEALSQLNGDLGSRAVILIGGEQFIRRVVTMATDQGVASQYLWLLATEWDFTAEDLRGLSSSVLQIMTVKAVTDTVENFIDYVSGLRYEAATETHNNALMPREWFEEFYQTAHDCTLSAAMKPINLGKSECALDLRIPRDAVNQNKYVVNTLAALKAATQGLSSYIANCRPNCNTGQPLNNENSRQAIKQSILNVEWVLKQQLTLTNNTDLVLRFNAMRYWNATYEVHLWNVQPGVSPTPTLVYQGMLQNPSNEVIRNMKLAAPFTSQCLESMAQGYCGCVFEDSGTADASSSTGAKEDDRTHRNYYQYDRDGEQQYDWPIWAIVVGVLTSIGIVVTVILFLILLLAYPKRGGTSILGYLAIVGIIGIYAINFAFFVHASEATCGARRFLMGVMYMITFSALLIKAIDNWRFSHVDYAEERYSGISSPCVLLSCALGLILVQCIIPIIWLILVHPTASLSPMPDGTYFMRHDNWWCDPFSEYDLGLVLSFIFVIFIVLVTAAFSALAFDSDRNNYESRWILFGCIATAGCFLVWMIVSTNAGYAYRDPAVTMANFVNATLLLIVLPLRKTILMCRARHEEEEEKDAMEVINRAQYDGYSNAFPNPAFELNDYDNDYIEG